MKPRVPLRRRLFLLAVAGILPLALMSGVGLSALYEQQKRLARKTSEDLTRALASAVDAELRLSVAALETLATAGTPADGDRLEPFQALAQRVLDSRREWHQILLADATGRVLVGTNTPAGQERALVEPDSFDALLKAQAPVVGFLSRGPLGTWGVPVRVPVFRDRRLRYVLTGVLKPEVLVEVMTRQGIPGEWVASVFDARGARVARSRLHGQFIGQQPSPSLTRLLDEHAGRDAGFGLTTALEGEQVYTAFTRLPGSRWMVALGIPVAVVERGALQSLMAYAGGVVLSLAAAILAALLVARRINRPIEQLREAAQALGQGQVPAAPASGIQELDAVAQELAASARQRAAGEAERERLLAAERGAREAAESARTSWELLARAGASLAGSLQPEATLEAIAGTVVPRIADWCRVDLLDAEGRLQRALTHHADPDKARQGAELVQRLHAAPDAPGSMAWVVATGRSYLAHFDPPDGHDPVRDADLLSFAQAIGMRSYFIVPLTARGHTFGALAAVQAESGREFGVADCALIAELAQRAALALDNARLYAAADAANRTKDEFLAMLGHELRNPLAPIVTALQLMERRGDPRTAFERRIIERQVAHMTRLVDDLLDVSRITQGKIELRRERLDLRTAVARAVELSQPLLGERAQPLQLDLPEQPVMVSGDPVRLSQVFGNLLMNAAKFTPPDGRIELRLRAADGWAEARLADTGAGMTGDLVPRVFDAFVQGPQQLHRGPGGLGLGLAIVKTLVELHGGTVTAGSPGPGQGSTFVVRLPLLDEQAMPWPQLSPALGAVAPGSGSVPVLVVDDNADAAQTTAALLEAAGYETRVATDGPGALALMEGFVPAVALLDIGLPGMDGYELAQRMRSRWPARAVKLVAVSGYGAASDHARALSAGFEALLVKPVEVDLLLAALARLLEGAAGRRHG
jgi:signal transduction histidine kinase/ActR/RegA family two-component response regulator/HAMP domain-containing protein